MEGWEIALLAVTGLIGIRLLTNMMRERHDRLVAEVQQQVDTYREQKAAEERRLKKQEKKKKQLEAKQRLVAEQQQQHQQERQQKQAELKPSENLPQEQEAA